MFSVVPVILRSSISGNFPPDFTRWNLINVSVYVEFIISRERWRFPIKSDSTRHKNVLFQYLYIEEIGQDYKYENTWINITQVESKIRKYGKYLHKDGKIKMKIRKYIIQRNYKWENILKYINDKNKFINRGEIYITDKMWKLKILTLFYSTL